jgi:hypothetical protein
MLVIMGPFNMEVTLYIFLCVALINQSNVFIKHFLHQLMSQSAVQKASLKPQTESNAGVEAR